MKPAVIILFLLGLLTTSLIRRPAARTIGVETAITYFKTEGPVFAAHCTDLQKTIRTLDFHDPRSLQPARQKLRDCRASWKRIEPFLEYFIKSSFRFFFCAFLFEAEDSVLVF